MHPYTPLTLATCFMITITVLNDTVASAVGLGIAIIIGVAARRWKIFAATLAMALPAALSFGLMYGLFGQWQSAAELSLRFAAILSGGLVLLTGYQTPQAIRTGQSRLQAWLVKRKVRSADQIATAAVIAAKARNP